MQCANVVQSDSVMNKVDRRLSKLRTKLFVTSQEELIVVDSACCKVQKTKKTQQLIVTEKEGVLEMTF